MVVKSFGKKVKVGSQQQGGLFLMQQIKHKVKWGIVVIICIALLVILISNSIKEAKENRKETNCSFISMLSDIIIDILEWDQLIFICIIGIIFGLVSIVF